MDIEKTIRLLESASGTPKHKELLMSLSDDDIRAVIDRKFRDKPAHIKAILFQGYKKQQAG